jgi:Protein of unknown function (DUF3309)
MAILELAVVLALAAIAAFPCWRHSADWGYGPSVSIAAILMAVAVVAIIDGGSAPRRIAPNQVATASEPVPSGAPPGRHRESSPPR